MLVILPFETEFYQKWDYQVSYVGHPLIEVIEDEIKHKPVTRISTRPTIALLPGSREQEIQVKLPVMLQMVDKFPSYQFVVAAASSIDDSIYTQLTEGKNIMLAKDQTYNLLKQSVAALVTSGTATLETALFGVPEVVCYKGNAMSFWIAKKLVKVKYISLVNLIMDKPVITELIQNDLNEQKLEMELNKLLNDEEHLRQMKQDYKELWHKLGDKNASMLAATEIISLVSKNTK